MANVIIYSTPTCGYCKLAKEFFQAHGVQYQEKDVASDDAARLEMFHKSQQMGVPVIDIDGSIVVGFYQPKIAELLNIS